MADEPQIGQEMDLLFLDQIADPVGYPALVRAVEVVPVYPFLDRFLDLGPGCQVQVRQDLPEVVLHHVVTLLGLTQSLRMGDRFHDVLDGPFMAEPVEGALASFDRIELGPVVSQELLRNTKGREAFFEQLDGLVTIRSQHDLCGDDEAGLCC